MKKTFLILGSLNGFLAVALGAFAAHGLKGTIPDKLLASFETGTDYQMYHALAIVLVALLSLRIGEARELVWSGWLLFLGIVLFSGSLYVMALTQVTWLGIITPFGGVSFLAGWVMLALSARKLS
ncbi:UPF0382 membrane protein YwdK [Paenibacillus sp. J31TS4]|uniref:DUF423 domain-containing protein n=1 Tax=Paenibacillus sp. J31TS4 TaxID=2807195 RepID=UPI001B05C088|nr:DUF423 domain-containing protein [Paenibacillus sp. J31TS4]GIP38392.1 UPF0382 membrane protein YwdK [Paenibacillus sp. J31TS4]